MSASSASFVWATRPSCYFIWKFGGRFSLNANGPSLASSDMNTPDADLGVHLERLELVHALGVVDGLEDRLHGQRPVALTSSAISSALSSADPSGTT